MSPVTALVTLVTTLVTLAARSRPPGWWNVEMRGEWSGRVHARPCAVCGTEFRPWRGDARYCSNACRQKAYRGRKAAAG
jgi:hypothetical protein